jgi:hypothetical protein
MGDYFYFGNNYWVVINTETIKSISSTCSVRRCNNVLRWLSPDGALYQYPANIDYKITGSKDSIARTGAFALVEGQITVKTQHNAATATIQPNQRFLFGNSSNWVCYKISGGGIQNYQNLETTDNTSYGILELMMEANYDGRENDDLTNGICDINKYTYAVTVTPSSWSGVVGGHVTLVPTVTLNGQIVTRDVTWSSLSTAKATVTSAGVVTLVKVGSTTIRCTLENNPTIYKDTTITIVASAPTDTYSIVISPSSNSILAGASQTYTAYLYKNGTIQADTFTFSVDTTNTVAATKYDLTTVTGNSFNVRNISMNMEAPLIVKMVSGSYTKLLSIYLKGVY